MKTRKTILMLPVILFLAGCNNNKPQSEQEVANNNLYDKFHELKSSNLLATGTRTENTTQNDVSTKINYKLTTKYSLDKYSISEKDEENSELQYTENLKKVPYKNETIAGVEKINRKNELVLEPQFYLNDETGEEFTYNYKYFVNPFSKIDDSNLVISGKTISFSENVSLSNMFFSFTFFFGASINSLYLTFNDSSITLDAKTETTTTNNGSSTNTFSQDLHLILTPQDANFTAYTSPEPYPEKTENEFTNLQSAFNNIKDNFTIKTTETQDFSSLSDELDDDTELKQTASYESKFTKDGYVNYLEYNKKTTDLNNQTVEFKVVCSGIYKGHSDTEKEKYYNFICKESNPGEKLVAQKEDEEEEGITNYLEIKEKYVPVFNDISKDLFIYSSDGSYSIVNNNDLKSDITSYIFTDGCKNEDATDLKIFIKQDLNNNYQIDKITYNCKRFDVIPAKITYQFSNISTTDVSDIDFSKLGL